MRIDEPPWQVERRLVLVTSDVERRLELNDLLQSRVTAILGAAGLGKSYEMRRLAEHERGLGRAVSFERLILLGQSVDALTWSLMSLTSRSSGDAAIYLDALDEVMIPIRQAGLAMAHWVKTDPNIARVRIRISCRSTVWPPELDAVFQSLGSTESPFHLAQLQPLSHSDVRSIVKAQGLDPDDFDKRVVEAGVAALTEQPLTLRMLLKAFSSSKDLPTSRAALFEKGTVLLASESPERLRGGTAIDESPTDILEAASKLAVYTLLSGREAVELGDSSATAIGHLELASLRDGGRPLDWNLLDAVSRTGLCDRDGDRRYRFGHRQLAEFLAGRSIASLLFHQARALLASPLGWRSGVAGGLRETAAFAAMYSPQIAEWVAQYDPEVVGLSDIADRSLKRSATLAFIEQCHANLVAESVLRDPRVLRGFEYDGAEVDLVPLLRQRGPNTDEMLECVIALVRSWGLAAASYALADLVLDKQASIHIRKDAGHALAEVGTTESRRRLLPLITEFSSDSDLDFKGIALLCNWPGGMTADELFAAIASPPRSHYLGAYEYFLYKLAEDGIELGDCLSRALAWAEVAVQRGRTYDGSAQLVRRVVETALARIDVPGAADGLAAVLVRAAENHVESPIGERGGAHSQPDLIPTLLHDARVRRRLLLAIAGRASDDGIMWWIVHGVSSALVVDDFPWLVEEAVNPSVPLRQRRNLAELSRMLPWMDHSECVDAWMAVREVEPIKSVLPFPLWVELASDQAARARESYKLTNRVANRKPRRRRLKPSPAERLQQSLDLAEARDPMFFFNICRDLTLEEFSSNYGFQRFLRKTPGWAAADSGVRARIIESAKRFLDHAYDIPQEAAELNSLLVGEMAALWLLVEVEREWLSGKGREWWDRWAWLVIWQTVPNLGGEEEGRITKRELLLLLQAKAPDAYRKALLGFVTSTQAGAGNTASSMLDFLQDIGDRDLDAALSQLLTSGSIAEDRVGEAAEFLIARGTDERVEAYVSGDYEHTEDTTLTAAAVTLLRLRPATSWAIVKQLLERRADLAPKILSGYAHAGRRSSVGASSSSQSGFDSLQLGELIAWLLRSFPPESDLQRTGVHSMSPTDSAANLRDRLLSWLGDQNEMESVGALRALEVEFGARYPWLRRPRARAERAYRLSQSQVLDPDDVAELLRSSASRLIRSGDDALEGIIAAVEQYARHLGHVSESTIEDLWNLTKSGTATPKSEEHVSDKLCAAIRNYCRDFAVTADREVQVVRRKVRTDLGGLPGSKVDVLFHAPGRAVLGGISITVPVEVKLAHNLDAVSALEQQLVERYMPELGSQHGLYAVVWMGRNVGSTRRRSRWNSIDEARKELEGIARDLSLRAECRVEVVVIDASLPVGKSGQRRRARHKGSARNPRSVREGHEESGRRQKSAKKKQTVRAAKPAVQSTKLSKKRRALGGMKTARRKVKRGKGMKVKRKR